MPADQCFIWLLSFVLLERVLGNQHPVPDRVFASSLRLLFRVFDVIMVRKRVGKHVQMSFHRNGIGKRKSAHPCDQLSAVLLPHVRERVPGDLPVIVYNPVPRDLVVRFRTTITGSDRVQKHLLVISEKAMDIFIIIIQLLHKAQRLHRLRSPVAVVPEKIQSVRSAALKTYLFQKSFELIQCSVDVADCVYCHTIPRRKTTRKSATRLNTG